MNFMRTISHWGQFEVEFDWLDSSYVPNYFPDDPFGPARPN